LRKNADQVGGLLFIYKAADPIVASRAEDSIVRDLVQEPREVTQSRQQQEILHDLLTDLNNVNGTCAALLVTRAVLILTH